MLHWKIIIIFSLAKSDSFESTNSIIPGTNASLGNVTSNFPAYKTPLDHNTSTVPGKEKSFENSTSVVAYCSSTCPQNNP